MKASSFVSLIAIAGFSIPARCPATNVATSTIHQPVNLGLQSDPNRIPLGAVGVISNYGYGSHAVIHQPRPCVDGAMEWKGGSELDQNLASVFGITVEPTDSSNVPGAPVILRLRAWEPPAYSPYTKEQVLAATLWCLLRNSYGTPESPLEVRVLAEGETDKPLEAKFSGNYITRPGKDDKTVSPVVVPGTVVETDVLGIPWVVFPEVKKEAPLPPSRPAMIVLKTGPLDAVEETYFILPIWSSRSEKNVPLRLNQWSADICYTVYGPSGRKEANTTVTENGSASFDFTLSEELDTAVFHHPRFSQTTFAANLYALVISAQPTDSHPLQVKMIVKDDQLVSFPAFRTAAGWKEGVGRGPDTTTLECKFIWDPVTRKLKEGSIPLVTLDETGTHITPITPAEGQPTVE